MEELTADAVVHTHSAGDIVNVAADGVAKIGDLVDESDLSGQKCVRGVLYELGGFERRDDDRSFDEVQRTV